MMTPGDWRVVEREFCSPYGRVELVCDGFRVTLKTFLLNRRLMTRVFVDGYFKGEWMINDCEERRRFLRPRSKYLHRKAFRETFKKLGKSTRERLNIDPEAKFFWYDGVWPSFKELKRHLIKNNKEISLVRKEVESLESGVWSAKGKEA